MDIEYKKQELDRAAVILNKLLYADTIATSGLFSTFVAAHISTAENSTVDAFLIADNQVALGVLGIVNGILAYTTDEGLYYHIDIEYRKGTNIIEMFIVTGTTK